LTGRHAVTLQRTSVTGGYVPKPHNISSQRMITPYFRGRLEVDEYTLPEALGDLGYYTGMSGKWHIAVTHNTFPGPQDHGFHWSREHRGVANRMVDRNSGFATNSPSDPYQLDENGFAFDQTTEDALEFLTSAVTDVEYSDDPFFLYFSTWLVHTPIHMRIESLLQKYALKMGYDYPLDGTEIFEEGQTNPYYAAMVEVFDYNVQQVISYLENTDDPRWPGHKLIENTYVILTSDNGGMERSGGEWITDNYPLDEGKIRAQEGGVRVPFIVSGPGVPQNVESNVLVNGTDLFPTLVSLAGGSLPNNLYGCDLSDLIHIDPQDASLVRHQDEASVRNTMHWHYPHTGKFYSTIRKDGWKLFINYDHVNNSASNPYMLYKLYNDDGSRNDIEEAVDLYDIEPTKVEELASELTAFIEDYNGDTPFYNPNYSESLPGIDDVPEVVDMGENGSQAWVTYTTDNAQVVEAELYYTLNGDGSNVEEWFRTPAAITSLGRVEAMIPTGTTHYVFGLIDENNFLIHSREMGQISGQSKDSNQLPSYTFYYNYSGPSITLFSEEFSNTSIENLTLTPTRTGFIKGSDSDWQIVNGVLTNTSNVNGNPSEGAAATLYDLSSLTDDGYSQLTIQFDYTLAEPDERLYLHLWGLVDNAATSNTSIINTGATNGNAWYYPETLMTPYNLGQENGQFTDTVGIASEAAIALSDLEGVRKTFSQSFDLSSFIDAPDNLAAYDYLVLGFTRNFEGPSPSVEIDNLKILANRTDGYEVWAADETLLDNGFLSDPDQDGIQNLLEYAFGTDPNAKNSQDRQISISRNASQDELLFSFKRRRDALGNKLSYQPCFSTDLTNWSDGEVIENTVSILDAEFEEVSMKVLMPNADKGFFKVIVNKD